MAFFRRKKDIPQGLWMKCPNCAQMQFTKAVEDNLNVCPSCDVHLKVGGPQRLEQLLDPGSIERFGEELAPVDVLGFQDESGSYGEKLARSRQQAGVTEAVAVARGTIEEQPVTIAAMDFSFRGGSMGVVVGERIALAADDAYARHVPLIVLATSGGARMQEGALSLMQMAKTGAVLARLREAGLPYISILADPCTGGVSASFAALGDITLAEPGALIGFAGPRVIQNTIRTQLPEGFQRSEFLLEKGYIDRIVHRRDLKKELARILRYLSPARPDAMGAVAARPPSTPTPAPSA